MVHRLRAYSFQISYGPADDRLHGFYVPALSASVRCDRSTGFFTSSALAVAAAGVVHLSANEWKKARHFDDKFWLYIVTDAATDTPQLHRIQNPATCFQMDEDIFAADFVVPEPKWRNQAVV